MSVIRNGRKKIKMESSNEYRKLKARLQQHWDENNTVEPEYFDLDTLQRISDSVDDRMRTGNHYSIRVTSINSKQLELEVIQSITVILS
ncbi:MAG: hypothetical protein LBG15_03840 [Dysgonamonadaceae bacterium]|jgi:hypothetical protein|nr:hypothetical protein [Dysgonamonadaceae bacterium]